ncbi:hypothetical protein CVT25_015007 [Psilocybe cyanescens]|uniref:Uncharacterized protein n=1 Tax=Psilocybe cyanescens TaxID=93625 RepID=A0A409W0G1_PSICY|nr:hypothetical protein CVT25_015007 [Psilocybe cyanescens]
MTLLIHSKSFHIILSNASRSTLRLSSPITQAYSISPNLVLPHRSFTPLAAVEKAFDWVDEGEEMEAGNVGIEVGMTTRQGKGGNI